MCQALGMARSHSNAQGEIQLVAEWLSTLPAAWQSKTHVKVGSDPLFYAGMRLTPAQQRAFGVWQDWCDARVVTPTEVWIVEGKLVATGGAYGQVLDYVDQYKSGDDYRAFAPRAIVPVVLCQAERGRTARLFAAMGVRTIVYAPSWSLASSLARIFPAQKIIESIP
jgi:hypothetical protein